VPIFRLAHAGHHPCPVLTLVEKTVAVALGIFPQLPRLAVRRGRATFFAEVLPDPFDDFAIAKHIVARGWRLAFAVIDGWRLRRLFGRLGARLSPLFAQRPSIALRESHVSILMLSRGHRLAADARTSPS
jgi:hypothetical protein